MKKLYVEMMERKETAETVTKISRRAWVVGAGLVGSSFTRAHCSWPDASKQSVAMTEAQTQFLISAILRQGVEGFVIQIVHSSQFAGSADEATGIFTRRVLEKFPGYSLAKTLVTKISLPPDACHKDKLSQKTVAITAYYAVSALMRRGATGFDVLLMNGCVAGTNTDDALSRILQSGAANFPNYVAVKVLISELDMTRPACSDPDPTQRRLREA